MRESEKAEAYTAAINLMVDQAVAAANPKSPGTYAATIRADLTERHRQRARELFAQHGELHPEHLAILLTAAGRGSSHETAGQSTDRGSAPPCRSSPSSEPWTPAEPDPTAGPVLTRAAVAERVAAIKAQLASTRKIEPQLASATKPTPTKESA